MATGPSPRVRQEFRKYLTNTVAAEGEPAALGKSATGPVYYTDYDDVEHKNRVWFRKGSNKEIVGVARADNQGLPDVPNLPIRVARRFGSNWVVDWQRENSAADTGGHEHDFDTQNVVTGSGAGSVGSHNVTMGNLAASSIEIGAIRNVVIGRAAASELTTGDENVYIGWLAGPNGISSGTGAGNVVIGSAAASELTGGDSNVYIGNQAGPNNTSSIARDNIAIGNNAGFNITTGERNVYIGSSAGDDISTGTGNIFIGYQAGANTTATEINNCVLIGYRAGFFETSDYRLHIEANSTGSKPLIYGEFDDRNVGFLRTTDMAGGAGVIAIANATTAPTGTPTGGGILYVSAGALRYKGSSGTDVQIAAA